MLVFTLGLPRRFKRAQYRTGALISAVGLTALQLIGAALFISHRQRVSPLAGYSAILLPRLIMLAWICCRLDWFEPAVQIRYRQRR